MLDLPVSVQSIYVHTIIKIYGFWVHELTDEWNGELQQEFLKVTEVMRSKISIFEGSTDLEVKERVSQHEYKVRQQELTQVLGIQCKSHI